MKNLFETLEFDKVLSYISENAVSDSGKERCLSAVVYEDAAHIRYELTLVNQAKQILDKAYGVADFPLDNFHKSDDILNSYNKSAYIDVEDILNITKNLRTARLINNFLEKTAQYFPELAKLRINLYSNKEFEDKIDNTFDNAMDIKDSASAELKSLRRSKKDTEINIKTIVSRLMSSSTFTNHLQDTIYTLRDERIVFQVKAESKNKIKGIVHDISASGQTFFIEPQEIVEINNKLKEINIRIQAEKDRIISALSQEIYSFSSELSCSSTQITEFDFIFAKAKYAIKTDSVCPEIVNEKIIELKGMKNPVLIRVCDNIVENNFEIGNTFKSLIISGSNTGGKTVVLKTVGLTLLMAKAGMFTPAYSAKIYPFKKIFAEIGDNQNIIQSLSTFSSHMKDLIEIVNAADSETIIFIDEITAGTDPKEGATLAQTILEYLYNAQSYSVITTHYSELKSMAYRESGFENASVEFNTESLTPTYRLKIGLPGASHAIEIAKNLGLKNEIIQKSKNIFYNEKDQTAEMLIEMQKTQFELSKSAAETLKHEKEIEELKTEYLKKIDELKKEKKRNIQIYKKKYETEIETARSEIKEIMKEVRNEKSEKIARRSFQKLSLIEKHNRDGFHKEENEITQEYKQIDWSKTKINDKLLLKDLNQQVELIALPDKNNNVQILMGMIKSTVKKDDLAVFEKKFITQKTNNPYKKGQFEYTKQSVSHTLDLRGKRVEEALDEVELYLDKASLANLTPVYIIHGHGTGALKQVIRDYLQTSPYAANSYPASAAEGGDGVTIVDLK